MKHGRILGMICLIFTVLAAPTSLFAASAAIDPAALVAAGFDHYRGTASISRVEMRIQRPTWQRTMRMQAWTRGTSESLIRITAPAKDVGNGTLKRGKEMWTYNPKVNRVLKLPPALMSQSWMGSDFSNNDLAKSDSILNDYVHTLTGTENQGEHTIYRIESTPKADAPVVWGLQRLRIRDDHVILSQEFFDEELVSVKKMTAHEIQLMGGRIFPKVWKMRETGKTEQYTQLTYLELTFQDTLPDRTFTRNALIHGGR
ncbi:MAG: outer membrane lipoprotein-sorting protein [Desulfosarcinaceae bacterium]|nr:outer membrane lipoprotein-sorting protein [Desulfosarcinaceae bacterium]